MTRAKLSEILPPHQLKLLFVLFIIPITILSELLRNIFISRYPTYGPEFKQTAIRSSDGVTLAIHHTHKYQRAVLVVHGYLSSSKRSIQKFGDIVLEHNYDIVAVNVRNHGPSGLSLPITGGYSERTDIRATLKWMQTNWKEVYVIGSSMGAYSSIYALAELPERYYPKGVVFGSFGHIKNGMVSTFTDEFTVPAELSMLLVTYIQIRAPMMFERDIRKDLNSFVDKIPTALAHSTHDKLYPIEQVQPWLQRKVTQAKYWTVPNQPHSELWRDDEYRQNVIAFFNSISKI